MSKFSWMWCPQTLFNTYFRINLWSVLEILQKHTVPLIPQKYFALSPSHDCTFLGWALIVLRYYKLLKDVNTVVNKIFISDYSDAKKCKY